MATKKKSLQGSGGAAWQTMSGSSLEALLRGMYGQTGAMSIDAALQQAAYLICCDIIAQDVAKAPLQLRRTLKNSTSELIDHKKHPLARMFALDPNKRHTWREFKEMSAYWFALVTNSYAYVKRNGAGEPVAIVPLQSTHVMDFANAWSGEVFYEITASTWQEQALLGFQSKRVPERDVLHVRGRMLDGFSGYSTLLAGQETLTIGRAIDDYRKKLFEEDAMQRGVFTRDKALAPLNELQYDRLAKGLSEMWAKSKEKGKPLVVEDGMDFKLMSSSAEQAELSKQLEAKIVDICRLLRIPPHKAFHLVNVKYENMEVLEKAYIGDTIEPILQLFEERYDRQLLTEEDRLDGLFIWFDRNALALRDPKVLAEQTEMQMKYSLITVNEGREKYGMSPIPGGDVRLVPANMAVIDGDNKVVIDAKPASSPAGVDPKKGLHLVVDNKEAVNA